MGGGYNVVERGRNVMGRGYCVVERGRNVIGRGYCVVERGRNVMESRFQEPERRYLHNRRSTTCGEEITQQPLPGRQDSCDIFVLPFRQWRRGRHNPQAALSLTCGYEGRLPSGLHDLNLIKYIKRVFEHGLGIFQQAVISRERLAA
jgi:hypothetical protein